MEEDTPKTILLELAGDRRIAIRDGARHFVLTLKQITQDMWLRYFDGIINTAEVGAVNEQIRVLDVSLARVELVTEALTGADGYATAEGCPVTDIANWQQKIPSGHRLAAAESLASASPSDDTGEELVIGMGRTVRLDAKWNCDAAGTGMHLHQRLLHVFREPTLEHERRYRRDSARSKVVGGSRTGKTIWLGAQRTLIAIYDELIDSTSGYLWQGQPLQAGQAPQVMDAYHKVVAASQLFADAAVE